MENHNKSTRIFASILGMLTGSLGLTHGIFEILKGKRPTDHILEEMGAFTIFPDYLFAGIATSIISLLVIICAYSFIHKKNGAHLYLLLSFLSVISGGGIAYILFILLNWVTATKINSQLLWFKKKFNEAQINAWAGMWKTIFFISYLLLIFGVIIWLFIIPPGVVHQVGFMHYLCWTTLGMGFIGLIFTIISGFARDIKLSRQKT